MLRAYIATYKKITVPKLVKRLQSNNFFLRNSHRENLFYKIIFHNINGYVCIYIYVRYLARLYSGSRDTRLLRHELNWILSSCTYRVYRQPGPFTHFLLKRCWCTLYILLGVLLTARSHAVQLQISFSFLKWKIVVMIFRIVYLDIVWDSVLFYVFISTLNLYALDRSTIFIAKHLAWLGDHIMYGTI